MEGYTPEEELIEVEKYNYSAEIQNAAVEIKAKKESTPQQNWLDFLFMPLNSYHGYILEAGLAVIENQLQVRNLSGVEAHFAHMAQYEIELELLQRRDPQARRVIDTWAEIDDKRAKAHREWEKRILETEGTEALEERKKRGEDPLDHETPEELNAYVASVAAKVQGGLLHESSLKRASEMRELGGFRKYRIKKEKEWDINFWFELKNNTSFMPGNEPKNKEVMANIERAAKEEGWFDEFQNATQEKDKST